MNNEQIRLTSPIASPSPTAPYYDDRKSLKAQLDRLEQERYAGDTQWRNRFAIWVIIVDSVWLIAVLIILVCNKQCFELPSEVLITLLGTTTLNVLGLAFIILKGLFGFTLSDTTTR